MIEEDTPVVDAPKMRQGDMTSDDQLISDFLNTRCEAAFERLVIRYGPMVLRVCRDILVDHSSADDAFQATFLVLFRQVSSIRDRDSVGRWLYEVACRVARRARNADSKRRAQERRALTMEAVPSPDLDVFDREWRPILHEEIRRLPAKFREAVVLCYLEGLTVEAAARKLGCPSGTLKSRLGKGRDLLRDRLTRRGLAASAVFLLMLSIEEISEAADPPEILVQATVRSALGDPKAISSQVASMALDEESPRLWFRPRVWVALLLFLAILGGVRWSLATPAAKSVVAPSTVDFLSSTNLKTLRELPFEIGRDSSPDHCKNDSR